MTIDQRLKQLRKEWSQYPLRRKIIEARAKALILARDRPTNLLGEEIKDVPLTVKDIKNILK